MITRRRTIVGLLVVAALTVATGCGDDDGTTNGDSSASIVGPAADPTSPTTPPAQSTAQSPTSAQQRDRDQDRAQIHDAATRLVQACRDRDEQRIRDLTHAELHDQLQGAHASSACLGDDSGAALTIELEDRQIEVTDDTATVQVRVHRAYDDGEDAVEETWQFHWSQEHGWQLAELPPLVTG